MMAAWILCSHCVGMTAALCDRNGIKRHKRGRRFLVSLGEFP